MKVFIIKFDGGTEGDGYGGGMAVVVANDKHEAYELIAKRYNGDDEYDEFGGWYCTENSVVESDELFTNITESKVVSSNFYRE